MPETSHNAPYYSNLGFLMMLNVALKQIRLFHRIRQKDLAVKLDISNSYLSELEKGHKSPSIQLIEKYSEIFSLSPSSILLFSEKMNEETGETKTASSHKRKILRIMEWITEGLDDELEGKGV